MRGIYQQRFAELWERVAGRQPDSCLFNCLWEAYSEPHRHYHNVHHLAALFEHFDEAKDLAEDSDAVEMALWYHDVVYEPERDDNELSSAEWFGRDASDMKLPAEWIEKVSAMIVATKNHQGEGQDLKLLLDLDLSIFATSPENYAAFEAAVREEYYFVPEDEFRVGRNTILNAYFERDSLYRTPRLAERWDLRAKENLKRELARFAMVNH